MLPHTLKNFSLFADGDSYVGKVKECTPPKITIKSEDHRAGGMDAPVKLDMGMEALVADFTMAGVEAALLRKTGVVGVDGVGVTLRGAFVDGSGTTKGVRIDLRGAIHELDQGTWKPGDANVVKYTMPCAYYKLTVDGEVIHEIDVINMVRVIGGVDQVAAQRKVLGLSGGATVSVGVNIGGVNFGVNLG